MFVAVLCLSLQPKGTKAEMAQCLLDAFGLSAATTVPVKLLHAVKVERSKHVAWGGPRGDSLHWRVNRAIDQMVEYDWDTWAHLQDTRVRVMGQG